MKVKEILSEINEKPTSIRDDVFGKIHHFEFSSRQHFNVNHVVIKCDELYVSNTGIGFYFKNGTGGRFASTNNLKDIKFFYHYYL